MKLYLSKANPEGRPSEKQMGEHRSGKYAARVQIGYEKDNSPKYRYFKTVEEYKKYLSAHGKKEDSGKKDKLKDKVAKEHRSSKKKQEQSTKERARSLFVKTKDKKESKKDSKKEKAEKSLRLFIRRDS